LSENDTFPGTQLVKDDLDDSAMNEGGVVSAGASPATSSTRNFGERGPRTIRRDRASVLTSRALAEPKGPHDAFVKYTFSKLENAAVTLRSVLPESLSRRVDWQSLRLESGSHVDHLLSDTHTDLLFSTSITGRRALLLGR